MRTFVAAAVAATMFAGSAVAADPFNGQGWQRSRPPAAIAYFKLPLQASKSDKISYGLALTAPTPRRYGNTPLLMGEAPKLLDLRFNGAVPNSLRLGEQPVWSITPAGVIDGEQRHLVGGLLNWGLGLALTAAAVYGVYTLLKKECPAISTTTGGCVEPAN